MKGRVMAESIPEATLAAAPGPDGYDLVEIEVQWLAVRLGDECDLDPLTVVDRMFGAMVAQMVAVLGLEATAQYLRCGAKMVEREAFLMDSHKLSEMAVRGEA